MGSNQLAWAIAILIFPILYSVFRMRFPPKQTAFEEIASDEKLDARFGKWERNGLIAVLVLVVPLGLVWYFVFRELLHLHEEHFPPYLLLLTANPFHLIVFVFFAGFASAIIYLEFFFRVLYFGAYAQFYAYRKDKSSEDGVLTLVAGVTIQIMVISIFIPMLDCHVFFTEDDMVVDRYFGIVEHHYPYEDIERIIESNNFQAITRVTRRRRWEYVVHFKSGYIWKTWNSPTHHHDKLEEVKALLSRKSGVVIEKVPLLKRNMH